jgi:acetyl-CoA C-acetyltransferase
MDPSRIPVLVGAGQITQREPDPAKALAPMDLTAAAARAAGADSGAGARLLESLDTLVVLRSFSDTSWRFKSPFGGHQNPPQALARKIGADAARRLIYTHPGGNMPQWCINRLSEEIVRGETRAVLIAGGEALATQKAAQRAQLELNWQQDSTTEYEEWGVATRGWNDVEDRHRMAGAIFAYPLIENAIRGHYGRTIDEHLLAMGQLFERFARVAADNPLADRRAGYSAEDIATPTDTNPYIGFPYTKLMNANAFIDQAAAVILTTVEHARNLGVSDAAMVYLHGCADAYDHWYLSDRINYHSSPAMRIVAREAQAMAGAGIDDIAHFDLYSCFPSAVDIATREMGIAPDDPRGLTVTGGLPYFGGPGNNYVTHSIAQMMQTLRDDTGAYGMVTANGNYVTKQSAGIYSSTPPTEPFAPKAPATYQAEIDAAKGPAVVEAAAGNARIETYTVIHDRAGPSFGIVFGRLDNGARFIANTPDDRDLLTAMTTEEFLNAPGRVHNQDGHNVFTPA